MTIALATEVWAVAESGMGAEWAGAVRVAPAALDLAGKVERGLAASSGARFLLWIE